MSHTQYSRAINHFLTEFMDSYVIFGVMAGTGREIVIRNDDGSAATKAELEKKLIQFVHTLKAPDG